VNATPQVFPSSTNIDIVDSHYQAVKARVVSANSVREFGGIVEARDWPFQQAIESAFYLAVDRGRPSSHVASWHSPLYTYTASWVWLVIGTDVAPGTQQSNRGDRYRTHFKIQEELLYGLWAGFCEKQQWTTDSNADGSAKLVATSYIPSEKVWWTRPQFSEKKDRSTGILFGYAETRLSAFAPAISS
jgi:hypothetical protein